MVRKTCITIAQECDVARARTLARQMALKLGFSPTLQTRIATVVTELSRNILLYAGTGSIFLEEIRTTRVGLQVVASDNGPGIENLAEIMSGEYDSKTGLGRGLFGTKVLVDEFSIWSEVGKGTRVTLTQYV